METTVDIISEWVKKRPDEPAIFFHEQVLTWSELDRRTDLIARSLFRLGTRPGDRLAYLGRNSSATFELIFASGKAGLAYVGLNWRLAENELVAIAQDCELRCLVVTEEFREVGESIARSCDELVALVVIDPATPEAFAYETLLEHGPEVQWPGSTPEDIAFLMYTSGTTGEPKGVMISQRNFAAAVASHRATGDGWALPDPGGLTLLHMPMFHIAGVFGSLEQLRGGGALRILDQSRADLIVDAIDRYPVRLVAVVPTMLRDILDTPGVEDIDSGSLRHILYGASPMPVDLVRRGMQVLRCGFTQHYGMTEATGIGTYLREDEHDPEGAPKMASAGRPFPGQSLAILAPDGTELPPGESGEICLRGPTIMEGYWGQPVATAEALRDGWLHTGDVGYVDDEGYLFVKDRLKDMIVSGGENIFSGEVELALMAHPDVDEAVVIGVPHEKWVETPKAFVKLKPGRDLTVEELVATAREHLAGYKLPSSIEFVDDLPRNQTGKVLKHVLREPYWRT